LIWPVSGAGLRTAGGAAEGRRSREPELCTRAARVSARARDRRAAASALQSKAMRPAPTMTVNPSTVHASGSHRTSSTRARRP
jgi:hypothetical protein